VNRCFALVGLLALLISGTAAAARPANSVSQSIKDGSTLSGSIMWTATPAPSGRVSSVHFFIDGVNKWTANRSPYQFNGYPNGQFDTTTLSNGSHTLRVSATWSRKATASNSVTVTVTNGNPPPPPPADHQPVAAFTFSPASPVDGSPVNFDASSSLCEDAPCTYQWEDDGPDGPGGTQWPLGSGKQISFTFNNCPCVVRARLNMTDVDGDAATTMQQIDVGSGAPPPPPPSGDTANLWVDNNGGSCTRSGSAVSYTAGDANSCSGAAALDAAYHAAQRGDTVGVVATSYPSLNGISYDASKDAGSGVVAFVAQGGSSPNLGSVGIYGARHVELNGLTVSYLTVGNGNQNATSCGSDDVTLRNLKGKMFLLSGYVCHVNVLGGSYGPSVDEHTTIGPNGFGGTAAGPHDILIDGVSIHDVSTSRTPGVHTECFQIFGSWGSAYNVRNITIRNSKFGPCPADSGGSGTVTGGVAMGGVNGFLRFQNNWIGSGTNIGLALSYQIENLTVDYNSSVRGTAFNNDYASVCGAGCGPYTFRGNYMRDVGCSTRSSYAYNVWQGAACSSTDSNVTSLDFVNTAGFDLHLTATANAINRGDPAIYPSNDIDGGSRPMGGRADAGADEKG
jgi:Bacterial Ig domain